MKKMHSTVVVVDGELNTFLTAAQGRPLDPKTLIYFTEEWNSVLFWR